MEPRPWSSSMAIVHVHHPALPQFRHPPRSARAEASPAPLPSLVEDPRVQSLRAGCRGLRPVHSEPPAEAGGDAGRSPRLLRPVMSIPAGPWPVSSNLVSSNLVSSNPVSPMSGFFSEPVPGYACAAPVGPFLAVFRPSWTWWPFLASGGGCGRSTGIFAAGRSRAGRTASASSGGPFPGVSASLCPDLG